MATLDSSSSIRSTVGYDCLPLALMDTAEQDDVTFPPYDIEKLDEDHYCIVMALPGFGADDLDVVVEPNRLVIRGKVKDGPEKSLPRRGITRRAFVKQLHACRLYSGERCLTKRRPAYYQTQARAIKRT